MIEYRNIRDFDAVELSELFLSVGWTSGNYPDKLQQAMLNSHSVISAWDGDKLVGLMNCLSDGVMTAYFHYLLVRPEYQGQGIGRKLVQMMFDQYSDCMRKVLIAYDNQAGFYEKCGFISGTGTVSMFCDNDSELTADVV